MSKVFTDTEDLVNYVVNEYRKDDTELSSAFFDVEVDMSKADILKAVAECQRLLNGDSCERIENGQEMEDLVPPEFYNETYTGNCKDFIDEVLNKDDRFFRNYGEEDEIDFVCL